MIDTRPPALGVAPTGRVCDFCPAACRRVVCHPSAPLRPCVALSACGRFSASPDISFSPGGCLAARFIGLHPLFARMCGRLPAFQVRTKT